MASGVPVTSLPAPGAYSHQPWVDALCGELLRASVPLLIEGTAPFSPRCLFLAGSAALGEAFGLTAPAASDTEARAPHPARLLLSDLDLGLITDHEVPGEVRRSVSASLGAAARSILTRHEAAFVAGAPAGPVGVGFLAKGTLLEQPPTLGLVDAVQAGRVLWGRERWLRGIPVPGLAAIPPYEAWRLIGNRALEWLAAELDSPAAPSGVPSAALSQGTGSVLPQARAHHARAKMATGLWTALLVLEGRYQVGWPARVRLLDGSAEPEPRETIRHCAAEFRLFLESPDAWARLWAEGSPAARPAESRGLTAALATWLEFARTRASEPLPADLPELGFLIEPTTLRARFRLWRHCGGRQDAARGPAWRIGLRGLLRPGDGTPAGRRMAAAALYWRLFGAERDDESVGPPPTKDLASWEAGVRRFLDLDCPFGPGLRARLRTLLELDPTP